MIRSLESILPEIERAVQERRESSTLASMDAGDLRDLVYKLVEDRHRVTTLDATRHFDELVQLASERHADMQEAKEHSVAVRAEILRELLVVLEPVLPSLLGPIHISTVYAFERQQVEDHQTLHGFPIFDGEKINRDNGKQRRSGHSWWIVALPYISTRSDPRYACVEHVGFRERSGVGSAQNKVEIVDCQDAGSQLQDRQIAKILRTLHSRIASLAGPKIQKTTDTLWRAANVMDEALETMRRPG